MEGLTLEQLQARLATAEAEKAAAESKAAAAIAEKEAAKAQADKLAAENSEILMDAQKLAEENRKLSAVVDAVEEEKAKTAPVEFDLADETYEFTCPTFTWDDGRVINVRAMANSEKESDQVALAEMCQELVKRNSGIIRRKED